MFTAKEPRLRAAAHAREVTLGQNSTSGGAKDTEVSELTVIPTASPEGLRPYHGNRLRQVEEDLPQVGDDRP